MLHKAWNSKGEVPYCCFPRSSIKFQGHIGQNITNFDPNWAFPDYRPVAAFKSLRFALLIPTPGLGRATWHHIQPVIHHLGDNDSPLTNHAFTPATGEFHPCSNPPPPLGDPFLGPTAVISWRGIDLGFPKPQCGRDSLSLALSRHHNFLAAPRLTTAPSSGTLTLWRHNYRSSQCKMCCQGEATFVDTWISHVVAVL